MDFMLSDSLMCLDMLHIGSQLAVLDDWMDWHHADVMDGHCLLYTSDAADEL